MPGTHDARDLHEGWTRAFARSPSRFGSSESRKEGRECDIQGAAVVMRRRTERLGLEVGHLFGCHSQERIAIDNRERCHHKQHYSRLGGNNFLYEVTIFVLEPAC